VLVVSDVFPLSLFFCERLTIRYVDDEGVGDGDRSYEVDRRLLLRQGNA
jgi:hypothetical protein